MIYLKKYIKIILYTGGMVTASMGHSASLEQYVNEGKQTLQKWFTPQSDTHYHQIDVNRLGNFENDTTQYTDLPRVSLPETTLAPSSISPQSNIVTTTSSLTPIDFIDAIKIALQRHPEITQGLASLAAQNANIDVAKAGYYPQISGGISTGDFTSGERGRQLIGINATQMLYDFGKIKSGVDVQQTRLLLEQASLLVNIDEISLDVAQSIVNIKRYQELSRISEEQIKGIARIAEIATLRANAGVSSQADPIQAQSYLELAESNLILQQMQLKQYQQKLGTLLGRNIGHLGWQIPEQVIKQSSLYQGLELNKIPQMLVAHTQVEIAQGEKLQTQLSRYPTLNIKGSLNQAVNGTNPNNNKDNGLYSSIMLEANSDLFQGGAISSRARAASYEVEAARANVNNVYRDIVEQTAMIKEQIENKQRQMNILLARQSTTIKTRELYQEQYKLGTRTAVDLLNAEQSIHSVNMEIENARYDIYDGLVRYISMTGQSRQVYGLNNTSIQGMEIQP